MAMTLT